MIDGFHKVVSLALGTAKRVLLAQLRGDTNDENDDDASDPTDNAEICQPYGVFAFPKIVSSLEAVVVRDGDEIVGLMLLAKGQAKFALQQGDVLLYNDDGAQILLKSDGKVHLVGANGTATKPVAHEGSITTGHGHSVTFSLTAPSMGGPVTGTIAVNSNTDTIANGAGSANVLVPDT